MGWPRHHECQEAGPQGRFSNARAGAVVAGNKGPDRLLRCGGWDLALTRQHQGRNEAPQCGCGTGREADGAPGPCPLGDIRASPGGSLGSACPHPLPRETLMSGPSEDPGCPPCLPAVDAAAPGLRWARLTAKRHWFQTCPQHTRKTSWFPGRSMDGTAGPAACAASPWPAAGAQTG